MRKQLDIIDQSNPQRTEEKHMLDLLSYAGKDLVYSKRYLRVKELDWRLTNFKPRDHIIDVGCGDPIDAIRFSLRGAEIVSLDTSFIVLRRGKKYLRERLHHLLPLIELVCADALHLPFKSDSFDTAVSYSAIEHTQGPENHRAWINEMVRATKMHGKVVITTMNRLNISLYLLHPFRLIDYQSIKESTMIHKIIYSLASYFSFWLSQFTHPRFFGLKRNYYETFFHPYALKKILEDAGLSIEKFDSNLFYYYGYGPPLFAFSRVALKIDELLNKFEDVSMFKIFNGAIGYATKKCGDLKICCRH